jgi:hypothetical protein
MGTSGDGSLALLDLLDHARLVKRIQLSNGLDPDRPARALRSERVATIVRTDDRP